MAIKANGEPSATRVRQAPKKRMTFEEFLAWADEDTRAEWVDGEVVSMAAVLKRHADLVGFLNSLLRYFVEAHQLGAVLGEPFLMKASPDLPARAPDLFFLAEINSARLTETHLKGPADLAIEVVSPESRSRDRGEKYYEYEQGGVREYWLVDPYRKQAEFYQLGGENLYRVIPIVDGVFRSTVLPGLWLNVAWLWQEPLPPVPQIVKEWGL